jgi:hypothetical protein
VHIWQLLMGAQLPVIAFLVAKWGPGNPQESLTVFALQIATALAAVAAVFLLGLRHDMCSLGRYVSC